MMERNPKSCVERRLGELLVGYPNLYKKLVINETCFFWGWKLIEMPAGLETLLIQEMFKPGNSLFRRLLNSLHGTSLVTDPGTMNVFGSASSTI